MKSGTTPEYKYDIGTPDPDTGDGLSAYNAGKSKKKKGKKKSKKKSKKKDDKSSSASKGAVLKGDVYEAEDAENIVECKKSDKHEGFQGKAYIDFGKEGSYVEWKKVKADKKGIYILSFRYGATSKRSCTLSVNNKETQTLKFESTNGWKNWSVETAEVELNKGLNSIKVAAIKSGPNIDAMSVQKK